MWTQLDPNGRRAKWISIFLEYDLEINPKNLVKGQVLSKMMAQSNCVVLGVNLLDDLSDNTAQSEEGQVHPYFYASLWCNDVLYVLQNLQAPLELNKTQATVVKLKVVKFCILNGYLYWKDPGEVLFNCLLENEAKEKMQEFHKGDCGGHLY